MLQRLGKSSAASEKAADISKAYRQQERHAKSWCASLGIHAISVSFEALVYRSDEILPEIATFLGATDKIPAMRACIDPALHRARNETSTAHSNHHGVAVGLKSGIRKAVKRPGTANQ
jgi:LPS sulfotransferase NodH